MANDPLHNIDVLQLDQGFHIKLVGFLGACAAHGLTLIGTSGYRSLGQQAKLHDAYLAGGPLAAPPGVSAHNYGMAVDFLAIGPGGKPIDSSDAPEYVAMEEIAPRYGLNTGRSWPHPDGGHVQLADWRAQAGVA